MMKNKHSRLKLWLIKGLIIVCLALVILSLRVAFIFFGFQASNYTITMTEFTEDEKQMIEAELKIILPDDCLSIKAERRDPWTKTITNIEVLLTQEQYAQYEFFLNDMKNRETNDPYRHGHEKWTDNEDIVHVQFTVYGGAPLSKLIEEKGKKEYPIIQYVIIPVLIYLLVFAGLIAGWRYISKKQKENESSG